MSTPTPTSATPAPVPDLLAPGFLATIGVTLTLFVILTLVAFWPVWQRLRHKRSKDALKEDRRLESGVSSNELLALGVSSRSLDGGVGGRRRSSSSGSTSMGAGRSGSTAALSLPESAPPSAPPVNPAAGVGGSSASGSGSGPAPPPYSSVPAPGLPAGPSDSDLENMLAAALARRDAAAAAAGGDDGEVLMVGSDGMGADMPQTAETALLPQAPLPPLEPLQPIAAGAAGVTTGSVRTRNPFASLRLRGGPRPGPAPAYNSAAVAAVPGLVATADAEADSRSAAAGVGSGAGDNDDGEMTVEAEAQFEADEREREARRQKQELLSRMTSGAASYRRDIVDVVCLLADAQERVELEKMSKWGKRWYWVNRQVDVLKAVKDDVLLLWSFAFLPTVPWGGIISDGLQAMFSFVSLRIYDAFHLEIDTGVANRSFYLGIQGFLFILLVVINAVGLIIVVARVRTRSAKAREDGDYIDFLNNDKVSNQLVGFLVDFLALNTINAMISVFMCVPSPSGTGLVSIGITGTGGDFSYQCWTGGHAGFATFAVLTFAGVYTALMWHINYVKPTVVEVVRYVPDFEVVLNFVQVTLIMSSSFLSPVQQGIYHLAVLGLCSGLLAGYSYFSQPCRGKAAHVNDLRFAGFVGGVWSSLCGILTWLVNSNLIGSGSLDQSWPAWVFLGCVGPIVAVSIYINSRRSRRTALPPWPFERLMMVGHGKEETELDAMEKRTRSIVMRIFTESRITTLDLTFFPMTDDHAAVVAAGLRDPKCDRLRHLNVTLSPLCKPGVGMTELLDGAKQCHSMRTLCGLKVAPLRSNMHGFKSHFAQQQLTSSAVRFLAVSVGRNEWRTLVLEDGSVWDTLAIEELAQKICFGLDDKPQSVAALSVRGTRMAPEAATALGNGLVSTRTLRFLTLGPWRSPEAAPEDEKEAKRYRRNKRRKQPKPHAFDTDATDALAHGQLLTVAVSKVQTLTQVHLVGDNRPILQDAVAHAALSAAFAAHVNLVKVTLMHCTLPSTAAHVLAAAVAASHTLRCLDLAHSHVTDDQAHSLFAAIVSNRAGSHLIELDLAHNDLTDGLLTRPLEGADSALGRGSVRGGLAPGAIVSALQRTTANPQFGLRWLNLSGNAGITIGGLITLVKQLHLHTSSRAGLTLEHLVVEPTLRAQLDRTLADTPISTIAVIPGNTVDLFPVPPPRAPPKAKRL